MVTNSRIGWFYCLIILWILLALVIPTELFRATDKKKSQEETKTKSNFVLTVKDNLISLNAKDA